MADPWGNDDSNSFGGMPPAPDPNDPNWSWDYNWLNPYGEFILNIPNMMPGPLMKNPPASYFPGNGGNQRPVNWATPVSDTNSRGVGAISGSPVPLGAGAATLQQQAGPSSDWDGTVGSASGPTIVDDPNQAASMKTNAEVSLHPDLAGQIEQYAKNRGISVGQYAIDKDGNIGFYDHSGNFVLERPPVGTEFGKFWNDPSATSASNALSAVGNMGAAHTRELADQAAAGIFGLFAGGPLDPASIPIAASTAAGMDYVLQRWGNLILGKNPENIDWVNAAGQGLLGGAVKRWVWVLVMSYPSWRRFRGIYHIPQCGAPTSLQRRPFTA